MSTILAMTSMMELLIKQLLLKNVKNFAKPVGSAKSGPGGGLGTNTAGSRVESQQRRQKLAEFQEPGTPAQLTNRKV